jgi:hypothetical protein
MDSNGQWLKESAGFKIQLRWELVHPLRGVVHELLQRPLVVRELGSGAAKAQVWTDIVPPAATVCAVLAGHAALECNGIADLKA